MGKALWIQVLVGLLLIPFALGQETPGIPSPAPPSGGESPANSPESKGPQERGPKGTPISLARATEIIRGAQREILLYLENFNSEALAKTLHHAVTQRGVNVKLLLPIGAFSRPNSYAMSFAFLSLRRKNLEIKVLGGGKVDPRVIVDERIFMVGYPLEEVPEEVRGPLLLFTEESLVKAEQNRFMVYWNASPYCRPKAEYNSNRIRTWCLLVKGRP